MDDLLQADADRIRALINADVERLAELLHEDLSWTHSSGRTDDKAAFLSVVESGTTVYKSLDVSEAKVSEQRGVYIYRGIVSGVAEVNGAEKNLRNKFLSVWANTGTGLQMLAWQSTGV